MGLNEIFASIYEMLYYDEAFSLDLYQEGVYSVVGIINLLTNLGMVLIFYYVINRPYFSRWYHWLMILIITVVISFVTGYLVPNNIFIGLGYEYTLEYIEFAVWNSFISIILFIVFTYLFKWWSTNAKGTPKLFIKF